MGLITGKITADAALSVGSSLLGGIFGKSQADKTNETNLQIARETNQANRELAEQQNKWNLEQWNRENEYNSPAMQRLRMLEAGINPLGQNFESGNASQLTSTNLANQVAPAPQDAVGMGNLVRGAIDDFGRSLLDAELIKSQVRKNNSDAGLSLAQQQTEDQLREYRVETQKWLSSKTQEEIKLIQANVDKLKSDKAYIDACKGLKESEKQAIDLTLPYIADMQKAQLDKTIQELENLKMKYNLDKKQIAYLDAQIKVCRSQEALNYASARNQDASARNQDAHATYTSTVLTDKTMQDRYTSLSQKGMYDSQKTLNNANEADVRKNTELKEQYADVGQILTIAGSAIGIGGAAAKLWKSGRELLKQGRKIGFY